MKRKINAIVAVDDKWGIGKENKLPWPHLSEDLKRFKTLTDGAMIVMGRNTWESLPKRPLPNRENIVISSSFTDDFVVTGDAKLIITNLKQRTDNDIWIIGGEQIYKQLLPYCDSVYVTRVHGDFDCDAHFTKALLERHFVLDYIEDSIVDNDIEIHYEIWEKHDIFN